MMFASTLSTIGNLDLLAVGIAIAAILVLGIIVLLNNRKSATNLAFFAFALLTILYGSVNYLSYHVQSFAVTLWLLRLTIFFAVWHAFSIFNFFYIFPADKAVLPKWYRFGFIPLTLFTSLATLTPFTFSGVKSVSVGGSGAEALQGPLIPFFGLIVVISIFGAIGLLLRKTLASKSLEAKQYRVIFIGTLITFSLLIVFNFILPVFLHNVAFIPFAPVFILPFIIFASYAVMKYHLLDVKIVTTEIMTFFLATVMLFEVILTKDPLVLIFRFGVFLFVLSFGVLLIRSVRKEIEQRIEMERLTAQLTEANKALEDLSHFKTQLLSLASHQIKSPLAAIKGFASILLEGLYGPVDGKVRETLEKIKKSANGLVELINTLLDFRRAEEGKMDYQFAKTDVVALVRSVVDELEPLASTKSLAFTFETSLSSVLISADAQKLKQVIQNIVDNSIKYTPSGFVRVGLTEDAGTILFSVTDSGLGIPVELIPNLFEEFIRDERVRKEIMGTGLGLYIARKIVEAHGGRIWAESKGANQGSAFYVALKKIA